MFIFVLGAGDCSLSGLCGANADMRQPVFWLLSSSWLIGAPELFRHDCSGFHENKQTFRTAVSHPQHRLGFLAVDIVSSLVQKTRGSLELPTDPQGLSGRHEVCQGNYHHHYCSRILKYCESFSEI